MSDINTAPPIPQRAMLVFAHPDDPDFSAAGTAAVWSDAGADVVYVLVTNGNSGSHESGMTKARLAEIRQTEQRAAAGVCGVKEVVFLGYDDGTVQPTLQLRKDLVRVIRQYQPDVIICGDPSAFFYGSNYINHPDHRAVATAALEAVFPTAAMPLVYPDLLEAGYAPFRVREVWVTDSSKSDTYVDISRTIARKIAALREHHSQLDGWDPTEMVTRWAQEAGEKAGLPLAEAYRRMILVTEDDTQPVRPAVGTPDEGPADTTTAAVDATDGATTPAGILHTSYGDVDLAHCHPTLRAEIAVLGDADPFASQRQAADRIRQLIVGLDDEALHRRPGPGEWTIVETLAHLVQTEIVYAYRYRAIVATPYQAIPGYDQEAWAGTLPDARRSPNDLLAELDTLKQINVTFLESLSPAQRACWGVHAERGPESVAALIGAIAGHDLLHERQIGELIKNRA